MNGAIPGCDGTVSDTGYSNTDIFIEGAFS
jgi:hypothetical protein